MTNAPVPNPRLRAVILGDTSAAAHHGCELVMENLVRGLSRVGIDIVYKHTGKGWSSDDRVVTALKDADLLVVNGEGTMHHDRPQGYDFVQAAERIDAAGKPAYLVNCTWQQNSPALAQRARVFRRIHVRESRSFEELAGLGITSKVTPDLTLATDWTVADTTRSGWLVTDSTMTDVTVELLQLTRQIDNASYIPVIASLCEAMSAGRQRKRQLVMHTGRILQWMGITSSYVSLFYALHNARAFLNRLSQSEAMLTGRFHAVCFAILTGTPFLALRSNSSKIESLLRDVGLSHDRMIERGLSADALRTRLQECQFTEAEEQGRQQFLLSARTNIAGMFEAIREDAQTQNRL